MMGVALMLTSCSTMQKTATTAPVNNHVEQYPTVTDLVVMDKIEVTSTWNFRPFHIGEPNLYTAQANLIAETLKEKGADVLLEPQFIFKRTSYGERVLTVVGYPAKFSGFRKATAADLEALKACQNLPASQRTIYQAHRGGLFGSIKLK